MPDILAFTIFVLIFTVGEYVAVKTKANVDVVLFVAAALLIGFWVGLPSSIYEASGILPMSGIIITLLLVLKRKNSTKIATIETTVMITAVQTKMEMVKAIHKVEIIMIKTVQLVKDKIKGKNVINLLHQVAALQVIPLLQLLQGKIIVVIVTAKKRIATAIIQKMVTAKVDHFA